METATLIAKAAQFGMVQIPEEITALVDILRDRQLRNVMEIGSESGGTFYLWCRLTAIAGLKISVDLPTGDSGSWKYAGAAALAERTRQFKRWSGNVHVVTGDSHEQRIRCEVADILHGEKLDFLFIDGDHSYEGVKADYEDYRDFVRPGGLIAFHDIKGTEYHRARGCHVDRFWDELQIPKQEIRGGEQCWGGIGIITV